MTITDEMLQIAAAKADQAIRDSLPDAAACVHHFSPQFERSMKRVLRRANHPVIYRYLHRAACFFIAAVLAGTSWLAVDVNARTAFFDWIRQQYSSFVEYRFVGAAPDETAIVEFAPTWLPDGYTETKTEQSGGLMFRNYYNKAGQPIYFICSQGADATSLFVVEEGLEPQPVPVGEGSGDFYQASDPSENSVLVWQSDTEEILFCLSAALPKSDLVKIAESISPQ